MNPLLDIVSAKVSSRERGGRMETVREWPLSRETAAKTAESLKGCRRGIRGSKTSGRHLMENVNT